MLDMLNGQVCRPLRVILKNEYKNKDKKEVKVAKGDLMNGLKNFNKVLSKSKGGLNLSDFMLFGVLGSVLDN